MSNVNMTVNVDGDGGCAASCPSLTHNVVANFSSVQDPQKFGPLTLEAALSTLQVIAGRSDCINATIQGAS